MTAAQYHPIQPDQHELALELWDRAFGPGPDYFRRYFDADPWYRVGDCLGAWVGGRLVSAVHICRRPLRWQGRTVWCGAISNVTTDPGYRRQGFSRELLRMAIARMEADQIDFSMLFTGSFGHYSALGWEETLLPRPSVAVAPSLLEDGADGAIVERLRLDWDELGRLQTHSHRPLTLARVPAYWQGWSAWCWRQDGARVFVVPERGYLVLALPGHDCEKVNVAEWSAVDAASEALMLRYAAAMTRALGRKRLALSAPPQFGSTMLSELGEVEVQPQRGMMLRNVSIHPDEFRSIATAYESGVATWWPADGF